jgi:pimeloyl-ACP methyl ester carboxylesterase
MEKFYCNTKYVDLKYGKQSYMLFGDKNKNKELLIFVPGITFGMFEYYSLSKYFTERYNDKYQILLFTLYGRGKSDLPKLNGKYLQHDEYLFVHQIFDLLTKLKLIWKIENNVLQGEETEKDKKIVEVEKKIEKEEKKENEDEFFYKKINIIGHSMGGAVTVSFVYHYPELINKMILLSPAGFYFYFQLFLILF